LAYRRINVDPEVREDIDVLSALIMSRSANTTIKYLLQCYEVYCKVKGFKNFEYLFKTRDAFVMTRNTLLYNLVFIVVMTTLVGLAWEHGMELEKAYSVIMLAGEARYGMDPQLAFTEISTDRANMGRACVRAAQEMFEKRDRSQVESHLFPAHLIERGTVARLN